MSLKRNISPLPVGIPTPAGVWQGVSRPALSSRPGAPSADAGFGRANPKGRPQKPDFRGNAGDRLDCNELAAGPGWIDMSEVW